MVQVPWWRCHGGNAAHEQGALQAQQCRAPWRKCSMRMLKSSVHSTALLFEGWCRRLQHQGLNLGRRQFASLWAALPNLALPPATHSCCPGSCSFGADGDGDGDGERWGGNHVLEKRYCG